MFRCIERWLKNSGAEKCPQCNLKAKKSDIRPIYARAISAVDTTDRDRALKELEEEKALRIMAQRDEAQALLQQNIARFECDKLKEEVRILRMQLESSKAAASLPRNDGCGSSRDGGGDDGDRESACLPPPVLNKEESSSLRVSGGKYCHVKSLRVSQVDDQFSCFLTRPGCGQG